MALLAVFPMSPCSGQEPSTPPRPPAGAQKSSAGPQKSAATNTAGKPRAGSGLALLFGTGRLVLSHRSKELAIQVQSEARFIQIQKAAGSVVSPGAPELIASLQTLPKKINAYIAELDAFTSTPTAEQRAALLPHLIRAFEDLKDKARTLSDACSAAQKANLRRLQSHYSDNLSNWGQSLSRLSMALTDALSDFLDFQQHTESTFKLAVSPESDK